MYFPCILPVVSDHFFFCCIGGLPHLAAANGSQPKQSKPISRKMKLRGEEEKEIFLKTGNPYRGT